MLKQFQDLLANFENATHLQIALADITFKFPSSCKYPNLSIRIEGFGLLNPLEGRTVSTLPEIHLALYLGAAITYHEAVVLEGITTEKINELNAKAILKEGLEACGDNDTYVMQKHLERLYNLRAKAKANDEELLQQLYKTYSNSLYGKLAQGIQKKSSFNSRDGASKRLPKSNITNSYYASMTTGLIRAALSAVIVAIQELIDEGHNYVIISATTDGCLYGIDESKLSVADTLNTDDKRYSYSSIIEALQDGYKKFNPFEKVDPLLAEKLKKFQSLRLLKISHEAWDDKQYIEVKHVANRLLNFKTRGQVGFYEEGTARVTTILAKAGHKIAGTKNEQAQWILEHYKDETIQKYEFTTLSSIQNIIDEECVIEDILSVPEERIISLDYDYKRYPISQHETAPHQDLNQFSKYRQSVDYLKRLRQRASIDAVDYKYQRAKQGVRKTGSNKEFVLRHILRALLQGVKPFTKLDMSYFKLAILLREFGASLSKIKHAKSTIFTPNMVQDTSGNRAVIRKILRTLNYPTTNNYSDFLELLLHKKITNAEEVSYLD